MSFDLILLPSQAVVPLGIALAHIMLCLYVLFRRRLDDTINRLFIAYLLLTILWNINLVILVTNLSTLLPDFNWVQIVPYGLIILGLVYLAFTRAFLQLSWAGPWEWVLGLLGLSLAVFLDMQWLNLPSWSLNWTGHWVNNQNIGFVVSVGGWAFFMVLALLSIQIQQLQTQSPAHKNRIHYLLISTLLLTAGYGLYLSLQEPFWTTGLILTWFGGALLTYIVVAEDLLDLGTAARRTIRAIIVAIVTVATYLAGIYLVQFFLGDFLTTIFLSRYLDPILLVGAVAAILLTIVYIPLRQIVERFINLILFGQHYDYQMVIHNYSQATSHILDLDELTEVALNQIQQTLQITEATLLILDLESEERLYFRRVSPLNKNLASTQISLGKNSPITQRLIDEGQALAQYTIDLSTQFKHTPEDDRQTLKSLNFEWFIPILKKEQLIGLFALGPKRSGQPYTTQDMRLLMTLADQTALVLENATLFDRLQRNLDEISRMKNLMDNVFDSIDNGVITMDTTGHITLINQAAQTILALPPDNYVGRPCAEALPSLANTILSNLMKNVVNREEHYTNYEMIVRIPNRGKAHLSTSLTPLKDAQNKPQGVTIVMDDLTETKRLQAVQDIFRRYVSPAVVDRLPSDPTELALGGHRQEVTVLFADLRGFTSFSENLSPEDLVDTLNQYLSIAATAILMYEGTLDKFMGDAVLGIFNAPLKQEDHVLRAVRAAAALQRAITEYHHNLQQEQILEFGVGLHVGDVVVGNIGMSDRMDYTVIGDTVNVAKRLQENAPGGKVLITEAVYEIVQDAIKAVFYEEMMIKGREQPVTTYELLWS